MRSLHSLTTRSTAVLVGGIMLASMMQCLAAAAEPAPAATPPAAEPAYLHYRGGCPNAFRKFAESQKTAAYTKITYFGGSITAGAGASKPQFCYREMLMRRLREDYPGAVLAENNASIGGTGSWLGAFRTTTDALYGGAGAGVRRVRGERRRLAGRAGLRVDGGNRPPDHRPGLDDRRRLSLYARQGPHGRLSRGTAAERGGVA